MKILIFIFCLFMSTNLFAQNDSALVNTSWTGTVNAPRPIEVVFEFLQDTLNMMRGANLMEQMRYEKKGNLIYIHKIMGSSPCDQNDLMLWKYSIMKNELIITPLSDECPGRSQSMGEDVIFTRYHEKIKM